MDHFSFHHIVNLGKLRNVFQSSDQVENRGFLEIHQYAQKKTRKVVTNLLKKVTPSEKQTTDTKQKETKLKYRSSFRNVLNLFKKHKIDHADYTSPYEGTNTCTVNPPALNLHQRMENLFVTCKEGSSDKYAKNEEDAMSDICSNGEIDQCNLATTDINAGSTSEDVEINIVDDSVHECVVGFFDKLFDSNSSCD